MFGRSALPRTHGQMMLDELARSYSHLKLAAGHLASGTAQKLAPAYDRARHATSRGMTARMGAMSPLYEQMLERAATARREYGVARMKRDLAKMQQKAQKKARKYERKRRRIGLLTMLAVGGALGAGWAMARRRRQAAEWEEFEPVPSVGEAAPTGEAAGPAATGPAPTGLGPQGPGMASTEAEADIASRFPGASSQEP